MAKQPRSKVRGAGAAAAALAAGGKVRQFYSPDGTDIRVCLPDGGIAIVGEESRDLPRKFWKKALQEGCYCTDQVPKSEIEAAASVPGSDAFTRRAAIKQAIEDAFDGDEDSDEFKEAFTANGTPNVRWIEKRVGFGVDAFERDELWAEVQREQAPDGDEEEEGADA